MRELDRLRVINQILEGRLSQVLAAERLDLSDRQVRRMCKRVKAGGPKGIVHGLRGRASNRQLEPGLLNKALRLVKTHYADFQPTFACEKLAERHNVLLSVPTLRKAMIGEGLWRTRRRKSFHRAWRARRACIGELIQLDGSIHDWFEGRGPKCWLIAYVDDATSRLMHAEFVKAEDTLTLMRLTRDYLRRLGRPLAFYVDRDSIYKSTRNAAVDEEVRDEQPMTQFTRAMSELDIRVICARSPQAKGRVERGFKTHQDRLVKELRLAGIDDPDAGNRFLRDVYLLAHNERFSLPPAHPNDAHRPLLRGQMLDRILCLRAPRVVYNDFTVRWKPGYLQLLQDQPITVRPKQKIFVEVRLDNSVHLRLKDATLAYKTIAKRPYQALFKAEPSRLKKGVCKKRQRTFTPSRNHPWKKLFIHGPYKVNLPANGTPI